jgi:hypothetical protein
MSRDRCDKKCLAPAFQINVGGIVLEPIVILQHRGLLLCALPLVEDAERFVFTLCYKRSIQPRRDIVLSYSSVLEVAQTLDCLNAIADKLSGDLSQVNKKFKLKITIAQNPFCREMI